MANLARIKANSIEIKDLAMSVKRQESLTIYREVLSSCTVETESEFDEVINILRDTIQGSDVEDIHEYFRRVRNLVKDIVELQLDKENETLSNISIRNLKKTKANEEGSN